MNIDKTGPTIVALGDTVQYTIDVELVGADACLTGGPSSIVVTDTVPSEWTITDPDGGTVVGNQIVWTINGLTDTLKPSVYVSSTTESGCDLCGNVHVNRVEAAATDCCDCLTTGSDALSIAVECPDAGVGLGSSRTISSDDGYEFCTPITYTNTYTFSNDSRWDNVDWSDMVFTETMPVGQTYPGSAASVTVNATDYTGQVSISDATGELVVDFGGASIPVGVRNSTMVITYRLDTHPNTCATATSWFDYATLRVDVSGDPDFGGHCTVGDGSVTIRDVVRPVMNGSRVNISVSGIPDEVGSCGEYDIHVALERTTTMPAYDTVLFIDGTEYAVIEVIGWAGVTPSSNISGTAVTDGYEWDYGDLFAGTNVTATLDLRVQARCLSTARLTGTVYYDNNCGDDTTPTFPMDHGSPDRQCSGSDSDSGTVLEPLLTLYKFPETKWADGTEVEWSLHIMNSGGGTAHCVQLIEEMGDSQSFNTATWSDASGVVTHTNQLADGTPINGATWCLEELRPGEYREIDVIADLADCDDDTNVASLQTRCQDATCYGPVSDSTELRFPPTDLVATAMAMTPIDICGQTEIVMTVRNAGLAPVYNLDLNLALPEGLSYVTNSAQYEVDDGGFGGAGSSEPLTTSPLTWSYAQGDAGLFGYLDQLDPGVKVELSVTVDVDCAFVEDQIAFYAEFDECGTDDRASTATNRFNVRPNIPQLSITKTRVGGASLDCGDAVTYAITVSNALLGSDNAPVTATLVTLTDTLGAAYAFSDLTEDSTPVAQRAVVGNRVTWEIAELGPGKSRTFDVLGTLGGAPCSSDLVNTVVASWGCGATDENPATPPDCYGTEVSDTASVSRATPDVCASIDASLASCTPSQLVTVTLENTAAVAAAHDIAVTITLPSGITYVNGSASPAPSSSTATALVYNAGALSSLAAGEALSITLQVDVSCSASGAIAMSGVYEDCCDNSYSCSDDLTPDRSYPELTIVKDVVVGRDVDCGAPISWTVTITNESSGGGHDPAAVTVATLTDTLGAGFTFVDLLEGGSSVTNRTVNGRTIVWEIANLAVGASRAFIVQATADSAPCNDDLTNEVAVTWGCEAAPDEDPATVPTCYGLPATDSITVDRAEPNLDVSLEAELASCTAAETITVTLENVATVATASGIGITVTLPTGVTYLGSGASPAPSSTGGSYLRYDPGALSDLGPGGSIDIVFDVAVGCVISGDITGVGAYKGCCDKEYPIDETLPPTWDSPTITLSKSPSSQAVDPGEDAAWTLTVNNTSTTEPVDWVVITDTLGSLFSNIRVSDNGLIVGNTIAWELGPIAPSSSQQVTVTATLDEPNGVCGATERRNRASATWGCDVDGDLDHDANTTGDRDCGEGSYTDDQNAFATIPDLSLSGSPTLTCNPNGSLTVEGTVLNHSTRSRTANGVVVSITVDSTFSTTVSTAPANIASGGSGTYSYTTSPLVTGVPHTIDVVVDPGDAIAECAEANNSASNTTTCNVLLQIDKDIAQLQRGGQWLNSDHLEPGDLIRYQVRITNTGSSTAYGLNITDTLPTPIASFVYQTGTTNASWPGNSYTTDPTGNGAAATPLYWGMGANLDTDEVLTLQFDVQVLSVAGGVAYTNTATAAGDDGAGQTIPAGSDQVTLNGAGPGLVTDKSIASINRYGEIVLNPTTVWPGDVITYRVTVTNVGPGSCYDLIISDTLPSGVSADFAYQASSTSATWPGGSSTTDPSINGRQLVWNLNATLGGGDPTGEVLTLLYRATVPNDAVGVGSTHTNAMVVSAVDGNNQDVPTDSSLPDDDDLDDADDTILTGERPSLDMTKTDALWDDADHDGVASPGDTVRYTLILTNSGDAAARVVRVSDAVPTHTSITGTVTIDPPSAGTVGGLAPVFVDLGSVEPAEVIRILIDVAIDNPLPLGVTSISNQAVVSSRDDDSFDSDDPDTPTGDDPTVTPVTAAPDVFAAKADTLSLDADTNGVPSPGDRITYTIIITNGGNQEASGVAFSDAIPANTSIVPGSVSTTQGTVNGEDPIDVTIGELAGGGSSVTITFVVEIDSPFPAATTEISNQGVVTHDEGSDSTDDPDDPIGDDDPTDMPITSAPEWTVTKTDTLHHDAESDGVPSPGDQLLYTVIITNSGNQDAADVSFEDAVPPNTALVPGSVATTQGTIQGTDPISVTLGTILGGGGTATITYRVTIDNPLPHGVTLISNQATLTDDDTPVQSDDPVTPTEGDPTNTSLIAGHSLTASKVDALSDDADGDGVVSPGDQLCYVVVVTNVGNQAAVGVAFSDTVPTYATLVPGSVQASQGTVVSSDPISVTLGSIAGDGATATVTFTVQIDSAVPQGVDEISNQGTAYDEENAETPTDDPDEPGTDDPTDTPLIAEPVLSADKVDSLFDDADSSGTVSPGDQLQYVVTIRNDGDQDAPDVAFEDAVPDHTSYVDFSLETSQGTIVGSDPISVTLGTIASGADAMITYTVQIEDPLAADVTEISNQGVVIDEHGTETTSDDPDAPGEHDPTDTPVVAAPDLSASKVDSMTLDADNDTQFSPGDQVRYVVTITNDGDQEASNVSFQDALPMYTALVPGSVETSQGSILGTDPISLTLGSIAGDGGMATITFTVRIDNPVPDGVQGIANQGFVIDDGIYSPTDDPDVPGDEDETETPITAAPVLDSFKSDILSEDRDSNGVPSPGDVILYEVTVINSGNQSSDQVTLTDAIPAHTALVVGGISVTGGTVTGQDPITVVADSIPGQGGQLVLRYKVIVDDPLPVGLTALRNQALAVSEGGHTVPSDDPDTPAEDDETVTSLSAEPVLDAFKRDSLLVDADGDGLPSPGDTLLYNITIQNTGNRDASGVVYDDFIPANVTLVPDSVSSDAGTVTSQDPVRVDIGELGGGDEVHICFRVVIDLPLPESVDSIVNQGTVSSDQLPDVPTDDPDTLQDDDETVTPVTLTPMLDVSKEAYLLIDADHNEAIGPGDTLSYRLSLRNEGNAGLSDVVVRDVVPEYTTVVVGSASTTLGTISSEDPLRVEVGALPGSGGHATISFEVTIDDPLPAGISEIANQAVVDSRELGGIPSDDPDEPGEEDPNVLVLASMVLHDLYDWHDPHCAGWRQRYTISFTNDGGAPLSNVLVEATLPPECDADLPSCSPGAQYDGDRRIWWTLSRLGVGDTAALFLEIRPWSVLPEGTVITTCVAVSSDQLSPVTVCEESTLIQCIEPTATPSATLWPTVTPTATWWPTPTPNGTPTPTSTGDPGPRPTATPTATPGGPRPMYLPLVQKFGMLDGMSGQWPPYVLSRPLRIR